MHFPYHLIKSLDKGMNEQKAGERSFADQLGNG
jgi:hypothetical protein